MKQHLEHLRYCLVAALALFCMACAGRTPPEPASPVPVTDAPALTDTRSIIVQAAVESMGTPYRWGGHAPEKGLDCSGLVLYAYQTAGIQVPRTATRQFQQGKPITPQQLSPGDLVFFTIPERKKRFHVGIYVGGNRFIHAPGPRRQVSRSDLDNPYFRKHYVGSRSFL